MKIHELVGRYLDYVGQSEAPANYHRWSFIACASAALGRRVYLSQGHFKIYPNLYIMLMGDPGARKSTAIGIAKDLLKESGFSRFAGSSVSCERFYMDLEGAGELDLYSVSQQFICADEFKNFMGEGNTKFISALTELFDAKPEFEARYKNSKSSIINNPCVSILGGCTHQSFSTTFPPSILHDGFLSRVLLIWGQKTGTKIPWMAEPNREEAAFFVEHFKNVVDNVQGPISYTPEGRDALSEIYHKWTELDDGRFITYAQRRYTHLLKLTLVCATITGKMVLELSDVVFANTLLVSIERSFSRALGEFGKAANSEEASIVMNALYNSKGELSFGQIWRSVQTSMAKIDHLRDMLQNLVAAGKIVHHEGKYKAKKISVPKLPYVDLKLIGEKADEPEEQESEDANSS